MAIGQSSSFAGSRSGVQFMEVDFDPEPIILAAAFNKWGMDIRSFREPLERSVRRVLSPSLKENFAVGGRPTWIPLSDMTIKEKARKGFAGVANDPLIRTGKLSKTVGYYNLWVINGPAGEAYISPQKMEGVFYGVYHNFGMASGADQPGYPQREWAIIQTRDADEIEEIFFDWIEERALRAGVTIG